MNKLKIVRKNFRAWLEENPDLTFKRRSSCDCPIAIYLGSGCDREVSVDTDTTMIDGETYANPPWVLAFTSVVDDLPGQISGKKAATLLR